MGIRSIILGWLKPSPSGLTQEGVTASSSNPLQVPAERELQAILGDLKRLQEIMVADGEENFVRGVRLTVEHLENALAEPEHAHRAFHEASETYQSMWGGMGSLSEFYVMNGAPEELARKRAEYDALVKGLRKWLFPPLE